MGNAESSLSEIAAAICADRDLIFCAYEGGGAFKQVFRVQNRHGETYALKIIKGGIVSERTEREGNALMRCDHPNIAKLISVGNSEFDRIQYNFTLEEYLAGGTLAARYRQSGFLSNSDVKELALPLIEAIKHIADLDLVHRDIKPENIMFRGDRHTPVLVDFNLVRDLSAGSLTQSWLNQGPGTPYFAAPEQLNNQKSLIDWRTDQFSLGVTLCYVRYGLHPYQFPGEKDLSPQTVRRVATRGRRSDELLTEFTDSGLTCLLKMTNAWPVERFRRPVDLRAAWHSMGDA